MDEIERDAPHRRAAAHLQEAVAALARDDSGAALVAASTACHAAPGLAEAHYVYGQAWAATGEMAKAERAFAEAVRLKPGWPDAWINYGVARYRQGAIEDAKQAMRRALRADPDHAAAAANLGAFLRLSGEVEGGERLLRARIAQAPGDHGARLNLAAEFLQEERAEEALELLQGPPPEAPEAARAWGLQRALALLQLRRLPEARAALDALGAVPAALAPLAHWRRLLLALAERDAAGARGEAERMEAALPLMGAGAVPEHAIMARFDLAKFWSSHNAPARAMAHWREGHRLLAKFQPFSRERHRAFVDAAISAFREARLRGGPRARNDDPAPVFVVGMPRSGTTLMEQILGAHRDVFAAGERAALGRAFLALGGGDDDVAANFNIAALGVEALDGAARAYLAQLHALAPGKARVIDKMPGNALYLGLVALLFPGAKVIHCRRDPRDIGLSIFTYRFHGAHPYAHDLADLGFAIAEHERLMAHWRAAGVPVLDVRLSDWVGDFDATLARVLGFLDLPYDEACARFHEQESRVRTVSRRQVREPVNARGLGRWRAYVADLAPMIAELEKAGALEGWE